MRSELPRGWRWARIRDQFQRVRRKNKAGVSRVLTASGEHGLIDQEEYFNKRVAARDLSRYYHLKRGEFAYNRSAMNGYPCGAIKRLDRYDDGVLSTLYLCFANRPDSGVLSDFAAQLFDSGQLDDELGGLVSVGARAHGLLNISPSDFMELSFPLPPVEEQRRIAKILSSADEAIQSTRAVIEQTRRVKGGLLQTLIPAASKSDQTDPAGALPKGWRTLALGKLLLSCSYGVSCSLSSEAQGLPVLRMGNLQHDRLDLSDLKYAEFENDDEEGILLQEGDLVFNRTNSYDLVGKVAIVPAGAPRLSFASYLLRLRVDPKKANPYWLWAVMASPRFQWRLRGLATKGVSQANINPPALRRLKISVPPPSEQDEIVRSLQAVEEDLEAYELTLVQYMRLKAGLLQELLTGKVRVKV